MTAHKVPTNVRIDMMRGLSLLAKFKRGNDLLASDADAVSRILDDIRRAVDGGAASDDMLTRMKKFFTKHRSASSEGPDADGGPSALDVARMLYGGESGRRWVAGGSDDAGVVKNDIPSPPAKNLSVKVAKVDTDLGLVFGYAIICTQHDVEYFDTQGDHIPEDAMLHATMEYMMGDRPALDMHDGEPVGKVVYGLPVTKDIAASLGLSTDRTGFVVGMKPNPAMLAKFKSGEFSGFSIGGRRVEDEDVN